MEGYPINYDSFQLLYMTDEVTDVAFGQMIENMTLAVFSSIILGIMTSSTPLLMGISISSFYGVMDEFFAYLNATNPTTQYASYKDFIYTHYAGAQLTLTRSAWQHSFYGYSGKNYAGNPTHITFYEIRDYEI